MKKSTIIIASVFGGLFLLVIIFICMFFSAANQINSSEQVYKAQEAKVESAMQRRYDLIPNLTRTVQGSMKDDKDVFVGIAKARQAYNNASTTDDKIKADQEVNERVGVLLNIIHEKYPKLESQTSIHELMMELEGSENRISVERNRYTDDVQAYNTLISRYPTKIVADIQGKTTVNYYKADSSAQKAPKISLN